MKNLIPNYKYGRLQALFQKLNERLNLSKQAYLIILFSITSLQLSAQQTPYSGIISLPGKVEAENFDNGGQGIAFNDATTANEGGAGTRGAGVDLLTSNDAGGGLCVGYTSTGEWLEYSVNVLTSGSYTIDVRVASALSSGKMHIEMNGTDVTGIMSVPNTTSTSIWQTATAASNISLTAGNKIMRVYIDVQGFNLNYVNITPYTPPTTQTPYAGIISLPGRVEAENFDNGGQGIAFNDATTANEGGAGTRGAGVDLLTSNDAGGGLCVGYTSTGEWLEYSVNVTTSGTYGFDVRVASALSSGKMHIEMNGENVTGDINIPNTNSTESWIFKTSNTNIQLTAGNKIMRIYIDAGGFNLNYVNAVLYRANAKVGTENYISSSEGLENTDIANAKVSVFPNPSTGQFTIVSDGPALQEYAVKVVNQMGETVYSASFSQQLDLQKLSKGVYTLILENDKSKILKQIVIQ